MTPISLTAIDLAMAALSLLVGSGLSILLALNLHRSLAIAALRMVAQLMLVGIALRYVFAQASPPLTLLVVAGMILAASFEVHSRQRARLLGRYSFGLGAVPVTLATVLVSGLALTTALKEKSWSDAVHLIPLVGIILGTTMNSTSLALNAMLSGVQKERRAIEARLALGADRYLALRNVRIAAAHNGAIPVINQMAGAGIITLPGIMTGQILAGMDPLDAARYQVLLMLLLAGAGILGVVISIQIVVFAVTDKRDRLRLDRVAARR